jgi:hypothetical protein
MANCRTPKLVISFLIAALFLPHLSLSADFDFVSSSSVDEVRRQIEKLPKDKIWWTVNGRDMAWNNKNLQRIFPTVVAILEDRGLIDVSKPIDFYLPELSASSFAGITVRNILDMAPGVDCPEEYEDYDSWFGTTTTL